MVLPFVVVGIGMLLAAVALVVDLGRLMLIRAELQAAADACALSAVHELNRTAGQLQRAERAGKFAASRVPRGFQDMPTSSGSDAATTVSFSSDGVAAYAEAGRDTTTAAQRFARCQVVHTEGIGSVIGAAVGATVSGQIAAIATATARPSSRACVVPLALTAPTPTNLLNFGLVPGTVYYLARPIYQSTTLLDLGLVSLSLHPTNSLVAGTYTLRTVDLRAVSGGSTTISSAAAAMAQVGSGLCDVDMAPRKDLPAPLYTAATDVDLLWPHWNARFGLYQSGSTLMPTSASPRQGIPPDLTGWAPPPVLVSSRSGGLLGIGATVTVSPAAEVGRFSSYQTEASNRSVTPGETAPGDAATNARPFGYVPVSENGSASETGNHRAFGTSGQRLAILPIFEGTSSSRGNVLGYACTLLHRPIGLSTRQLLESVLNLLGIRLGNSTSRVRLSIAVEYLGLTNAADSPCRSSGLPGAASATGPLVPSLVQ